MKKTTKGNTGGLLPVPPRRRLPTPPPGYGPLPSMAAIDAEARKPIRTREEFIEFTGAKPEDMFGPDWKRRLDEINSYDV